MPGTVNHSSRHTRRDIAISLSVILSWGISAFIPLGQRLSQTGSSELGKIRTTFARAAHQFAIDGDSGDGLHAELVGSFSSLRCRHIQHPDFARRTGGSSDRRDEVFTSARAATEDFNLALAHEIRQRLRGQRSVADVGV